MNKSEYLNIYRQEETHFYYRANHRVILSLLTHYAPKSKLKILDAGCGTGFLARKLEKFGVVEGVDFSDEALKYAKKRGVKAKKGSLDKLPYKDHIFDAVTCMDVINHKWVKDEQKALEELYRVLKPGGILVLRVSANPWIKLKHDEHVLISHRYSKNELKRALTKAKFKIIRLSYINLALLPVATIKSFWERFEAKDKTESGVSRLPGIINSLLYWILNIESYIIIYMDILFGIGLVSVCKTKLK